MTTKTPPTEAELHAARREYAAALIAEDAAIAAAYAAQTKANNAGIAARNTLATLRALLTAPAA